MSDWTPLEEELERWADAGEIPAFWLRDDDAIEPTEALEKLLAVTRAFAVPLALAVIPALAKPVLAERLATETAVSVLQHGFAHANHAVVGAKKSEFADDRPIAAMTEELVQARAVISRLFGARALSVFAPPWNRIGAKATQALLDAGITGLSRFKPRQSAEAAPGVVEVNTHVDLIDWRAGRVGKTLGVVTAEIAAHLAAKRTGAADRNEPTGLLAHHLVTDSQGWAAMEAILERLAGDRRVRFAAPPSFFAEQG